MAKLMKHELRANSRIMLPLFLLAALLSVLGGLSARFLNAVQDSLFLKIVFGMFIAIFVLAISLMALLCLIYMVQRFYETIAGREAYLTLNLPVSIDGHICSKLLTAMIWSILTMFVTIAVIAIFLLVSAGSKPFEMLSMVYFEVKAKIAMMGIGNAEIALLMFEVIIMAVIQLMASYLIIYTSIAIGQQSTEKKLGSSIAAFAGISVITNIAGNLVTSGVARYVGDFSQIFECQNASFDLIKFTTPIFLSFIGFGIAQCLVYYFVSSWILKTKLNLS